MDGSELGHFSLLEKIGEGGMGQVYKARDTRLERLVAIKLLAEARLTDADLRARFVQEAKAPSALNHPNIITIHEIGEHDGRTFIVMELVDGKPLNELIHRKGMRLTEALRIGAQVADALASAHAAGIVHRDLKPANIMVDAHGRVKVLDFGMAKLFAPAAVGADEATRTLSLDRPVTEEGAIVGSVPYMSPEQAEGKPVDARSDIFSFGAVLYEMITGQRAFPGESRISTLAAVVEKDPPPPSGISSTTPPELDRLIARCLRKDVERRSQNMADVKLALEELRDESESGKLARPATAAPAGARRWLWPALAGASVLIAVTALAWTYLNQSGTESKPPDLVRLSPDDGYSYGKPAISPDGGFVAYVSDRSGKDELWLHQVGGSDPIQLTHSAESVSFSSFFPDGKRIVYVTNSADGLRSTIQVMSALGGESRVLIQCGRFMNWDPMLSPDGSRIAYFERSQAGWRLMTVSSSGGQPRELPAWAHMGWEFGRVAWTPDSRYLLCLTKKPFQAETSDRSEWSAFPVDGGDPVPTGVGDTLYAAGLEPSPPVLIAGNRALFWNSNTSGRVHTWEISFSPGLWHLQGRPHQLTFGALSAFPSSISAAGTVALQVGNLYTDFHLIPLSPATCQPIESARKLTEDFRDKSLSFLGGNPGSAYFQVRNSDSLSSSNYFALDLDSGKQTLVAVMPPSVRVGVVISPDGRHVAYSVPEGSSYSIRIGDAGTGSQEARMLCKACGTVQGFSPDGRFLFYAPEASVKPDSKRKFTVRLLELASGKNRPWLEDATDSVFVNSLGPESKWVVIGLARPGSRASVRRYLVPWREEVVPRPEWIHVPLPDSAMNAWQASPIANCFYYSEGSRLMTMQFAAERAGFSEPHEVNFVPGSAVPLQPNDRWQVGRGLVFQHHDARSSVWLMKLSR